MIGAATAGKVHGFDTFEGLPEDWTGNRGPRGEFSAGGVLPPVPANVVLHKGLFEETLPPFMEENREGVAFAHVDCDLYGSKKTIFENVGGRLRKGSVLVFDDYFNFPGWRNHEFKAFQELVEARSLEYRYIGYARHQAAVVIDSTARSDHKKYKGDGEMGGDREMNQDPLADVSPYLLLSPYPPCIGFPSLRPCFPCGYAISSLASGRVRPASSRTCFACAFCLSNSSRRRPISSGVRRSALQ